MTAETGAGERKVATIVFADLVGSTELGAAHDPERTRALLDRFYDAMAAEVERAGGTIEKFAGTRSWRRSRPRRARGPRRARPARRPCDAKADTRAR
jgi:class 3 adenylate cyclase